MSARPPSPASSRDQTAQASSFAGSGLRPDLIRRAEAAGISAPTPVQKTAIPQILTGEDMQILAPTGTGKTATYLLPLLEQLCRKPKATALIIVPTRELARQVADQGTILAPRPALVPFAAYGGTREELEASGTDPDRLPSDSRIVVATPGRLLDMLRREELDLTPCRYLVLDEGDRLMSAEFREEMEDIRALLPPQRQTVLTSATLSARSEETAKAFLHNPRTVRPEENSRSTVRQAILLAEPQDKAAGVEALLRRHPDRSTIIFTETRDEADTLYRHLRKQKFRATVLHGRLNQASRNASVAAFENGSAKILVATDIAARGLDIEQVGQVINMSPPALPETYLHRIGRTGRAGRIGWAATLCSAEERRAMHRIEKELSLRLNILPPVTGLKPRPQAVRKAPQIRVRKKKA